MTENEMADAIMAVLGMDQTEPRITEVEADFAPNGLEVMDDEGNRFIVTVTAKLDRVIHEDTLRTTIICNPAMGTHIGCEHARGLRDSHVAHEEGDARTRW